MMEIPEFAVSIDWAQENMARGEVSSQQLTGFYLDRIESLNSKV